MQSNGALPSIPAPKKKGNKKSRRNDSFSREPIQDRVIEFGSGMQSNSLEGPPEQKWMRLNEVLAKMSLERIELMYNTSS